MSIKRLKNILIISVFFAILVFSGACDIGFVDITGNSASELVSQYGDQLLETIIEKLNDDEELREKLIEAIGEDFSDEILDKLKDNESLRKEFLDLLLEEDTQLRNNLIEDLRQEMYGDLYDKLYQDVMEEIMKDIDEYIEDYINKNNPILP